MTGEKVTTRFRASLTSPSGFLMAILWLVPLTLCSGGARRHALRRSPDAPAHPTLSLGYMLDKLRAASKLKAHRRSDTSNP